MTLESLLGASMENGSRPSKTRIHPYSLFGRGLNPRVEASRRSDLRRAGGDEACRLASQTMSARRRQVGAGADADGAMPARRTPLHYNWVGDVVGVGNMLFGHSGT